MKAITLHQPFASLIILGVKHFETRSWNITYRGKIAIHAGKAIHQFDELFGHLPVVMQLLIKDKIMQAYGSYDNLPTGATLGTATIDRVYTTERATTFISDIEQACGDYSPCRYAWSLQDAKPFNVPIPCKGQQGIWNWSETTV